MPSIFDMFGDPALADEDAGATFDLSDLGGVLDQVLKDRPVAGRPVGYDPSTDGGASAPVQDGEASGAGGADPLPAAPVAPEEPPASAPLPPPAAEQTDPLGDLSEIERLELSQLRQALNDPDRAMGIRRALLGVETPAPSAATAAPVAPPEPPQMPEEFMPGSAEAKLWESNQRMERELAELRQGQQAQQAQTEQERMTQAAARAAAQFELRYAGKLTRPEVEAICQTAGMQKLPAAFYPTTVNPATGQGNWDQAMDKALEFTMRSNDALLTRVLGLPPTTPAAPAPGTRTPEADARGRKLTALSSAASPSGEGTTRQPIQSRGDGTGKMSEKSRLQLVQEMMAGGGLTGSPE